MSMNKAMEHVKGLLDHQEQMTDQEVLESSMLRDRIKSGKISDAKEVWLAEELAQGKSIAEINKIDPIVLETMYAQAYQQYEQEKYHDALKLFQLLVLFDYKDHRFLFGVASCYQMMDEWKAAVSAFAMLCSMEPKNPVYLFHMSECLFKLSELEAAKIGFKQVLNLCKDDNSHKHILKRAQKLLFCLSQIEEKSGCKPFMIIQSKEKKSSDQKN